MGTFCRLIHRCKNLQEQLKHPGIFYHKTWDSPVNSKLKILSFRLSHKLACLKEKVHTFSTSCVCSPALRFLLPWLVICHPHSSRNAAVTKNAIPSRAMCAGSWPGRGFHCAPWRTEAAEVKVPARRARGRRRFAGSRRRSRSEMLLESARDLAVWGGGGGCGGVRMSHCPGEALAP